MKREPKFVIQHLKSIRVRLFCLASCTALIFRTSAVTGFSSARCHCTKSARSSPISGNRPFFGPLKLFRVDLLVKTLSFCIRQPCTQVSVTETHIRRPDCHSPPHTRSPLSSIRHRNELVTSLKPKLPCWLKSRLKPCSHDTWEACDTYR